MKGKVNWFNIKRGYGFIIPEDKNILGNESKDIFVHYSGIENGLIDKFNRKYLEENQIVEFEISENSKGKTAINVKVIGDQNPKPNLTNSK